MEFTKVFRVSDLKNTSITNIEFNQLINDDVIEMINNNEFVIKSKKKLLRSVNNLFDNKRYLDCLPFLTYLTELYPLDSDLNFKLLYIFVIYKNYDKAINIIRDIINKESDYTAKYAKVLLLLISNLYELPDDLKKIVFEMQESDLLNKENGIASTKVKNNARKMIFNKSFREAYLYLKGTLGNFDDNKSIKLDMVYVLTSRNFDKNLSDNEYILFQLISKDYNSVLDYLTDKSKNTTLSSKEQRIIALCNTILNIKNNGIIPNEDSVLDDSIEGLIDAHSYKNALVYLLIKTDKRDLEKEVYYYLLNDILDLCICKNKKNSIFNN